MGVREKRKTGKMGKRAEKQMLQNGGPSENRTRMPVKAQVFESHVKFHFSIRSSINPNG